MPDLVSKRIKDAQVLAAKLLHFDSYKSVVNGEERLVMGIKDEFLTNGKIIIVLGYGQQKEVLYQRLEGSVKDLDANLDKKIQLLISSDSINTEVAQSYYMGIHLLSKIEKSTGKENAIHSDYQYRLGLFLFSAGAEECKKIGNPKIVLKSIPQQEMMETIRKDAPAMEKEIETFLYGDILKS